MLDNFQGSLSCRTSAKVILKVRYQAIQLHHRQLAILRIALAELCQLPQDALLLRGVAHAFSCRRKTWEAVKKSSLSSSRPAATQHYPRNSAVFRGTLSF